MASTVEAACDSEPESDMAVEGQAGDWSEELEMEDEELRLETSAIFDDIEAAEDHVELESRKVSSQFERLEALLQAAQLREQVEEKEDQACEEGRERELDNLASMALEVDRMVAISEEAADAEAADKAETHAEGQSCGAAEAAASTVSACSSGAQLFPGRSSPSPQAWSNDVVADVEVVIDDSEDEQGQSSSQPTADDPCESAKFDRPPPLIAKQPPPSKATAAELEETSLKSRYLDSAPLIRGILSETLPTAPKDAVAHDRLRSHYLLLLERAAQQRRQLNETLAEIKTVEESLGLAANATVATAPAGEAPPAKRARNGDAKLAGEQHGTLAL